MYRKTQCSSFEWYSGPPSSLQTLWFIPVPLYRQCLSAAINTEPGGSHTLLPELQSENLDRSAGWRSSRAGALYAELLMG